jgi:hypothetical protein
MLFSPSADERVAQCQCVTFHLVLQTYGPLEVASFTAGCFTFTNTLVLTNDDDGATQLVTVTPGTQNPSFITFRVPLHNSNFSCRAREFQGGG